MHSTLHRLLSIVITFCAIAQVSLNTYAHEIRPAIIDLNIQDNGQYELVIRLNLEAIIAEIGPKHKDTTESANASKYNVLRALSANDLNKEFESYQNKFIDGIHLNSNQGRLKPMVAQINSPQTGNIELARDTIITLAGTIPANTGHLTWGWQTSFGANALRVSTSNQPDIYTVYLQPGETSAQIPLENVIPQPAWEVFGNYIVIGFEHIVPKGLDHILFVVGLFLLSLKLAPLLWQITSFTIAHSVTLALGILGYVNISPGIVEPLIALSIVYVCVENIFSDKLHKWRPIIIFSFGLLHGLGFASVLGDIGLNSTHFVTGLIAFNLGIEFGQLTVIALCFFAITIWFRHKDWYRQRITIPASAVIAMIGAYWFIERTIAWV